MDKTEITRKLDSNLRFIITISAFFLTIIPSVRIEGSSVFVSYILIFVALQTIGDNYTKRDLHWMNYTLLTVLVAYALLLVILSVSTQEPNLPEWGLDILENIIKCLAFVIMIFPIVALGIAPFPLYRKYLYFKI